MRAGAEFIIGSKRGRFHGRHGRQDMPSYSSLRRLVSALPLRRQPALRALAFEAVPRAGLRGVVASSLALPAPLPEIGSSISF